MGLKEKCKRCELFRSNVDQLNRFILNAVTHGVSWVAMGIYIIRYIDQYNDQYNSFLKRKLNILQAFRNRSGHSTDGVRISPLVGTIHRTRDRSTFRYVIWPERTE